MGTLSDVTTGRKSDYEINTNDKTGEVMIDAFTEENDINTTDKDKEVTFEIDDKNSTANGKDVEFTEPSKNEAAVKDLEEKVTVEDKTKTETTEQNTATDRDTIKMGDEGHKDKNTDLHNSVNDTIRDTQKEDVSPGFIKEAYSNVMADKSANVKANPDSQLNNVRKIDPTHIDAKVIAIIGVAFILAGPGIAGAYLAQRLIYQHTNKDAQISTGMDDKIQAANNLATKENCSFDEALYRVISRETSLHVGVDELVNLKNDIMGRDNVSEGKAMETAIFEHAMERSGLGNIIQEAENKFNDNPSISYEKAFSEALKDCGCSREDLKDKEDKFEHEYKLDTALINNFGSIANCEYNRLFNVTNITEKYSSLTFSAENTFNMTNYNRDHSFDKNDFDKIFSKADYISSKNDSDIGKEIEKLLFKEEKIIISSKEKN